jgi:hypothetical protein
MLVRYGSSKILKVSTTLSGLDTFYRAGLVKRSSKNLESLDLDPENNVYLRNRAVSALEIHGPNQNWDAFEYDELSNTYTTFIGNPISVDHVGENRIGIVIDSEFIPCHPLNESLGIPVMPFEATLKSLNSLCRTKDTFSRVYEFASKANLVRGSDEKRIIESVAKAMTNTGWVENIWAVDKDLAESHRTGLVDAILRNEITDTSMGAAVEASICSACGHIATGELPEHEDFCDCIRLHKGSPISIEGAVVIPFEINRDFEFFEDSLILPFKFGGQAGGEGADKDAKLLESFGSKKAYIETSPQNHLTQDQPDRYALVGDMPENVREHKDEFLSEKREEMKEFVEEQSAPGNFPEGTIISIMYEDDEVSAVVVDEYEDGTLNIAIDDLDEPLEISTEEVLEVITYPEEMSYKDRLSVTDINTYEMTPESRGA